MEANGNDFRLSFLILSIQYKYIIIVLPAGIHYDCKMGVYDEGRNEYH